jgi:natural product precursor
MKNFKKNQLSTQELKDVKGGTTWYELRKIQCEEYGGEWLEEFHRCSLYIR